MSHFLRVRCSERVQGGRGRRREESKDRQTEGKGEEKRGVEDRQRGMGRREGSRTDRGEGGGRKKNNICGKVYCVYQSITCTHH